MGIRRGRSLRAVLAGSLALGSMVVGSVVLGAVPASATTPTSLYVAVGKTGNCTTKGKACGSIQTAITTAEGATYNGKNVIIKVAAGTYTENDTIAASSLASLAVAGAGASSTTVSGNNGAEAGTVFTVNSGTVSLSGLTITNGQGTNGGGISNNSGGNLFVTGDTITGNSASNFGGGIANGDNSGTGTLTVTDATITENTADNNGGGIANGENNGHGALTVTDSTITGNTAQGESGGIGNGDFSGNGTLTVAGSTFLDNSAGAGAGGGAIDNGDNGGYGNVIATDSTFSNNTAYGLGDGGAIDSGDFNGSGSLTVTGSTFSDNSGENGGDAGAIDNADDGGTTTLTVTDSTFSGNSGAAGDIANGDYGGNGTAYIAADILDDSCDQAGGTWTDNGYNLGTDGSCLNGGTGDVTDPGLSLPGLANNGGPTQTILPAAGPPVTGVIPTGTNLDGVSVCPRLDQRGAASQGNCAIGADEPSTPPFFFSTTPLPPATPGTAYGPVTLTTDGAVAGAKFKWKKVTLPEGLKLSSKGVLSGTPNVSLLASLSSITVQATEMVGAVKTTIEATIPLTIT